MQKLPTYFLSHGGGPWPWLKAEMPFFDKLEASLQDIPKQLGVTPRAVLMVSAHWEEDQFTVMSTAKPGMIYDYSGFPEHTYRIQYPAPGSPEVALEVQEALRAAGIPAATNSERGFDHGMYAPMYPIYPKADVPVLQLSLKKGYDPESHFQMGRALAPLRDKGILILGSGLSFHNLRAMQTPEMSRAPSQEFDHWLQETIIRSSASVRQDRLNQWAQAPSARFCHPREDHLLPLMVAVGAAEKEKAELVYHDKFMGAITVSGFRFG